MVVHSLLFPCMPYSTLHKAGSEVKNLKKKIRWSADNCVFSLTSSASLCFYFMFWPKHCTAPSQNTGIVFLMNIPWEKHQGSVSKLSLVFLGKEGTVLWGHWFCPPGYDLHIKDALYCYRASLGGQHSSVPEWNQVSLFILYLPSI